MSQFEKILLCFSGIGLGPRDARFFTLYSVFEVKGVPVLVAGCTFLGPVHPAGACFSQFSNMII